MCRFFFSNESVGVVESDHMDLKLLTKCSAAPAEVPEAQDTLLLLFLQAAALLWSRAAPTRLRYTSAALGGRLLSERE